jgi:hypothetical protein
MHQCWSQYKLTPQDSRFYHKGKKDQRRKENLCLYCCRKNHQARDCPIKALASKLHKDINVSTSTQSKVEDVESKNVDI